MYGSTSTCAGQSSLAVHEVSMVPQSGQEGAFLAHLRTWQMMSDCSSWLWLSSGCLWRVMSHANVCHLWNHGTDGISLLVQIVPSSNTTATMDWRHGRGLYSAMDKGQIFNESQELGKQTNRSNRSPGRLVVKQDRFYNEYDEGQVGTWDWIKHVPQKFQFVYKQEYLFTYLSIVRRSKQWL